LFGNRLLRNSVSPLAETGVSGKVFPNRSLGTRKRISEKGIAMKAHWRWIATVALLLGLIVASPLPGGDDPFKGVASALRQLLVDALPDPLYEASPGWGNARMVAHAVRWRGQGIQVHPEIVKPPRNAGVRRTVR